MRASTLPPSEPLVTDVSAIYAAALRYHKSGQVSVAEPLYRQVLRLDTAHSDSWHLLGVIAHQVGRSDAGITLIGRAIVLNAGVAAYHSNIALSLRQLDHIHEAIASCRKALILRPDFADAHSNMGIFLKDLGRLDAASVACRTGLYIKPDTAEAHCNLGNALQELGNPQEAILSLRRAIICKPNAAEASYNMGNSLKDLGRLDDALVAYDWALRIRPDHVESLSNRGQALYDLGQFDRAISDYHTALCLNPDSAKILLKKSVVCLLRGNFDAGWALYEWRWRGGTDLLVPRKFHQPQWRGEDIAGKTILLHAEQGMGDAIQFCRFVALVSARGARVTLEVPKSLLRLLSCLEGVDLLLAKGDPLPDFDLHCPLMSLPLVFRTTPDTIPANGPYLVAEAEFVAVWRERLPTAPLRIGIAWQGNPLFPGDRDRSFKLGYLAPLSRIQGVRLISLQKNDGLEQLENLPDGMRVERLPDDFDAGPDTFIDTAAVMMNLDLIVTADTAVGHLAGALGCPVWLPLASVPHWVWMLGREDTPWYPRTRLFRQSARGDWRPVFDRMAAELTSMVSGRVSA